MNEELMQEIKGTLPWLVAAAIIVGGWYGWKGYSESRAAAGSAAVANTFTVEEIEEAAAKFDGAKVGGALKLRLAKKYFDGGRYQEALDLYDELTKDAPDGFADVPVVGRAQCLEALGKYDEARQAFDAYAEANDRSYLALTAKLGGARCLAQAGGRDKALERLAALKETVKDDAVAKLRVEQTEDCVRR